MPISKTKGQAAIDWKSVQVKDQDLERIQLIITGLYAGHRNGRARQ